MNRPTPAIVSQAGARQLPRWALLLVCAAYLLPGQFGRDAWRHADLGAYGFMAALAQGQSSWWSPQLGGIASPDGALLPYWLGALFIKALPFLDPALAARLPFIAVLAGVFALVWYACFHLARTGAAQPVSFAFGGEAAMLDYARALADGALLALMASLGLLVIGHETSPELLQLLGAALWLYALACAPYRALRAQGLTLLALLVLALSGGAALAALLAIGGLLVCQFSRFDGARQLRISLALGLLLVALLATWLDGTRLQAAAPQAASLLRLLAWFLWPTALFAAWTLWRWRGHYTNRHLSVPLTLLTAALLACLLRGGSDRALLLTLPALAVLASFALPTLQRGLSSMVDWFSVFFFSAAALFVWLYYLALQTDWLPRLSANIAKRAPDLVSRFDAVGLIAALAGSIAWLLLVRWRTSAQRPALWRSLVLPAGGTTVVWLLMMTLWLPAFDYARSNRELLGLLRTALPAAPTCVAAPGQALSLLATVQAQGGWQVRADTPLERSPCDWALIVQGAQATYTPPSGWRLKASLQRPTERSNRYLVLERAK